MAGPHIARVYSAGTIKMTQILSLPVVALTIQTGNNEDWIDAIKFVVDDGTDDPTEQLDLRGMSFEMEIRSNAESHEVVIAGSTEDGRLMIGEYPDFGFLIIAIEDDVMRTKRAGGYIGDIVARDSDYTRRCITFDLIVIEGVTK